MDPLTHTFFGAVLADTGLKRRSALATATLIIGANLPDIDVASYFEGGDAALGFRRGWTHGVLALAVLPFVLTFLIVAWDRWRRRRGADGPAVRPAQILWLAALAIASHPLLDYLNTYGVRLLMPFHGRWFYGDALFIVDPWIWLTFGGALFLNRADDLRSRLRWAALALVATVFIFVGAGPYGWGRWVWAGVLAALVLARLQRRHPSEEADRRRRARLALAAGTLYALGMAGWTFWVAEEVRKELREAGIETSSAVLVGPDRIDPFVRLVVAPTEDGYRFGAYHPLRRPRFHLEPTPLPTLVADLPRGILAEDVVSAARGAACLRGMVNWTRYPFYEVEATSGGAYAVHILDARYVRRRTRGFGADSVVVGPDLLPRCDPPERR